MEKEKEKSEVKVRKGAWTKEEDILLTKCIHDFGEGKWHLVPPRAGLNRCRKSCRMRWLNYLKPNVKRGYFDPAEVDLIRRLHKLLGNRWSLIAGRIPGRTANDVKNFWNTHICKKQKQQQASKIGAQAKAIAIASTNIIKPRPRNLTKSHPQPQESIHATITNIVEIKKINPTSSSSSPSLSISSPLLQLQEEEEEEEEVGEAGRWWENMLQLSSENGEEGQDHVGPLSSLENDSLQLQQTDIDMDGLMSDLLLDFHVWENTTM